MACKCIFETNNLCFGMPVKEISLSCRIAYSDASVGGNAKQNKEFLDQSVKNINLALETVVSSGVKFFPSMGALPSGLVPALWPNPDKNKGLV